MNQSVHCAQVDSIDVNTLARKFPVQFDAYYQKLLNKKHLDPIPDCGFWGYIESFDDVFGEALERIPDEHIALLDQRRKSAPTGADWKFLDEDHDWMAG